MNWMNIVWQLTLAQPCPKYISPIDQNIAYDTKSMLWKEHVKSVITHMLKLILELEN